MYEAKWARFESEHGVLGTEVLISTIGSAKAIDSTLGMGGQAELVSVGRQGVGVDGFNEMLGRILRAGFV